MEPVDTYVDLTTRLTRRDFANKFPMLFLLKRPSDTAPAGGAITFRTQTLTMNDQGLLADSGAFADGYWVWALLKRSGNPFPERISIGRATNCDVVFRLGYVSKLHAHIVTEGETMTLLDQGSSNGTEVNGQKLKPHAPCPIRNGDRIKLGRIDLRLLDAEAFYDLLTVEVLPSL
jgi:hypothetical protein